MTAIATRANVEGDASAENERAGGAAMTSPRAFRARVVGSDGIAGVETEVEVSARGVRVDRIVRRGRDGDDGGGEERRAMLGKFPSSSVVSAREGEDAREAVVTVAMDGRSRVIRLACANADDARALVRAVLDFGDDGLRQRSAVAASSAMGAGSASTATALARDLREENLLLSDALRAAEEALAAARSKASEGEDYFDNSTVSYEIKVRNLTKNLEFQEARVAQLRADVAEQQGKIERYRALEEVLGKENEALRKDLKETREERDRSLRRAEASEIMAAHAKNEVAALESGQVSEPEIYDENIELKREIAIANSARATTDEHLKVTLAHLRAAREENVRITEELLKKTEEHLDNESRLAELEQMMDGATLRESTNSKELAIAVQERNDAVNRIKVFEKDTKRLSGEVERLVGRLGDAERSALREKEEIRFECAEQVQEHAARVSKQTALARDASIEAQKQATLAHNTQMAKQELEYELHEERRRRMALERQIEHMEAAKQTIKDFTADAEATVIRSIQAQREANLEVQRLRIEKHDLRGKFPTTPSSSSPSDGKEAWRAQLGATLDLHRVIRGSPASPPPSETRAGWSRVTDFGSGAAFVSKRPPPSSAQRLDEIKSEIAIIKQRQTPVKKSLETKFDLQDGPRVTTAPNDVFSARVSVPDGE
tara:strand:- start:11008 stop:12999 length:1992 start_codon:yes stop_codon:yes gene_type:complete